MPFGQMVKTKEEREVWLEMALRVLGLEPGNLPWEWVKTEMAGVSKLVCKVSGVTFGHGPGRFSDRKYKS